MSPRTTRSQARRLRKEAEAGPSTVHGSDTAHDSATARHGSLASAQVERLQEEAAPRPPASLFGPWPAEARDPDNKRHDSNSDTANLSLISSAHVERLPEEAEAGPSTFHGSDNPHGSDTERHASEDDWASLSSTSSERARRVDPLPSTRLTQDITGLDARSLELLYQKRQLLTAYTSARGFENRDLVKAMNSTLVFAREEAGTAVCVSQDGLLVTCLHVVGESDAVFEQHGDHWLLFVDGRIVKARFIERDVGRNLALLRIVAAQGVDQEGREEEGFSFIPLAAAPPPENHVLACIGQPGWTDPESGRPGVRAWHDVLYVSAGPYRGPAEVVDDRDNSDAIQHDCWTHWGHGGSPLVDYNGYVAGLHSFSVDGNVRRGVGWEALKAFFVEHHLAMLT